MQADKPFCCPLTVRHAGTVFLNTDMFSCPLYNNPRREIEISYILFVINFHDLNTRVIATLSVERFVASKHIPVLEHYSPDLAPCDAFKGPKSIITEINNLIDNFFNGIRGQT